MNDYANVLQDLLFIYDKSFDQIKLSRIKNSSGYDTIVISSEMTSYRPKIDNVVIARIKDTGINQYISFKSKYKYWFDERDIYTESTVSDQGYLRVSLIDFWYIINNYDTEFSGLISKICLDTMSFPKFGCCHRYMKCSEKGKCVHDDLLYSTACEYRHNLESGKVFYGAKANDTDKQLRFACIDVETPNMNNDAICSIGIAVIENGKTVDSEYYLIDPETYFDKRNIQIHGISEQDIKGSPVFPVVWKSIERFFIGYLLTGHNLGFDLSCLNKVFSKYNMDVSPIYYIDTLTIARKCLSKCVENFKLPTLCKHYGIVLDNHHNALCDTTATAELLNKLYSEFNFDVDDYIRQYSFDCLNVKKTKSSNKTTKLLNELNDIITDVTQDGILEDEEVLYIKKWLSLHEELKGNYPFDKIFSSIEKVLEDNIITDEERFSLLSLMNNMLNPVEMCCSKVGNIDGAYICLSGNFDSMSKNDFAKMLEERGAVIKNNVSSSLDYLVVGDRGSELWSQGNYGTKVKKAMELNEKGSSIIIVKESDVLSCFMDE